jgi:hypothetical protein
LTWARFALPTLRSLIYLAAVFRLLRGLNALRIVHHWEKRQATFGRILTAQAKIAFLDRHGIVLCIAYQAQRRLGRRSVARWPNAKIYASPFDSGSVRGAACRTRREHVKIVFVRIEVDGFVRSRQRYRNEDAN